MSVIFKGNYDVQVWAMFAAASLTGLRTKGPAVPTTGYGPGILPGSTAIYIQAATDADAMLLEYRRREDATRRAAEHEDALERQERAMKGKA